MIGKEHCQVNYEGWDEKNDREHDSRPQKCIGEICPRSHHAFREIPGRHKEQSCTKYPIHLPGRVHKEYVKGDGAVNSVGNEGYEQVKVHGSKYENIHIKVFAQTDSF